MSKAFKTAKSEVPKLSVICLLLPKVQMSESKKTQYGVILLLSCCHLFLKHDTSGPEKESRFEG